MINGIIVVHKSDFRAAVMDGSKLAGRSVEATVCYFQRPFNLKANVKIIQASIKCTLNYEGSCRVTILTLLTKIFGQLRKGTNFGVSKWLMHLGKHSPKFGQSGHRCDWKERLFGNCSSIRRIQIIFIMKSKVLVQTCKCCSSVSRNVLKLREIVLAINI